MDPAKKSQRLNKLRLHKETLKHVLGGSGSTVGPECNTIPSQQGTVPSDCDDTADGCTIT